VYSEGGGLKLSGRSAQYLQEIGASGLACFTDQMLEWDTMHARACIILAKVAKGEILLFFNEVFDALCKVDAPIVDHPWFSCWLLDHISLLRCKPSVKNGGRAPWPTCEDIVSESAASYVSFARIRKGVQDPDESDQLSTDLPTAFSLAKFIPLLKERIHVLAPHSNIFVQWLTFVDTIPDWSSWSYYRPSSADL